MSQEHTEMQILLADSLQRSGDHGLRIHVAGVLALRGRDIGLPRSAGGHQPHDWHPGADHMLLRGKPRPTQGCQVYHFVRIICKFKVKLLFSGHNVPWQHLSF